MSEPVKTFSVGFAEDGERTSSPTRAASPSSSARTTTSWSSRSPRTRVELDELVWHLDEPLADLSALGFLALCELAAQHVTVALSGQGADELFGGYRKHRAAALVGRVAAPPGPLRAPAARRRSQRAAAGSARRRHARGTRPGRPAARDERPGRRRAAGRALRGPLARARRRAARREVVALAWTASPDDPLPATLLSSTRQLALVDDMLHYFDRASMAHSLEVRVPFLDHEFVEFCAAIPADLKVRAAARRSTSCSEVARGLVPERIIDKPKVGFFRGAVAGGSRPRRPVRSKSTSSGPIPHFRSSSTRTRSERLVRRTVDEGEQDTGTSCWGS